MTNTGINALTSTMENAISDGIEFFKTNAASDVKIDIWTLREVLCHLIYWHQITLQGINSVVQILEIMPRHWNEHIAEYAE